MSRTYPYTAWVLTSGFVPKEATFTSRAPYGRVDRKEGNWTGVPWAHIYATQATAIAGGHARLDEQQARLNKAQSALNKRRETLRKAEGK